MMRIFRRFSKLSVLRQEERCMMTLPRKTEIFADSVIDNILYPPFDIEIPKVTFTDMVWQGMNVKGHLPAVTCGLTDRTLTHREVQDAALRFSATLQGLENVKTIGLLLPNCIEYPVIVCGALHAGVTVSTLNPVYTAGEVSHQLQAANVDLLIADHTQQEKVTTALSNCTRIKTVLYVDVEGTGINKLPPNSVLFQDFLSQTPAISGPKVNTLDDIAILPFSSGTTGPPKGVQLTQHNLLAQSMGNNAEGEFMYRAFGNFQEVTIAVLPMFHIFGLGVTMGGALWSGTRQVTIPRFDPALYINCIEKYSPTYLHIVPPLVNFLASHPQITKKHLSSLRQVNCGAAPCGESLIQKFHAKAPQVLFKEGWGMTEVAGASTSYYGNYSRYHAGSVNRIHPNMRMRIVDTESNETLGAEQTGEIQVKGDLVMKGYFNNQEATENTFTQDGWMRTGDVGRYTKDGIVFLSDRIKELIKVKGLQVAPAELEDTLRDLPGVLDVAVVGVDDEKSGQVPRAFIVREESLTEEKIHAWMSEKLSPHKQLAGGVVFIDAVPKSASGKILRRELAGK